MNSPKKILTEAGRRSTDAATPIRDIKRKPIKAWIARDEAEMAAVRGKP